MSVFGKLKDVIANIIDKITSILPNRPILVEEIDSIVPSVSKDPDGGTQIVEPDKYEQKRIVAKINRFNDYIKKLDKEKEQLVKTKENIKLIETSDISTINEAIEKLNELVKNKPPAIKNKPPAIEFTLYKSTDSFDAILERNNLLNQFQNRIEQNKEKEKEQLNATLDEISTLLNSTLLNQYKLDEAKQLINQISEKIDKSYKHEIERLEKLKQKLKEKEYLILQEKDKLEALLKKKPNWQEFQRVLENNNIETLYHFTDIANIKSIKEHGGLFSWHYCEINRITIPFPGGGSLSRDLDRRYSLQDYVRVSFTQEHPMMYVAQKEGRIQAPVVLTISLDICYFEQTQFANMNATKREHSLGTSLKNLNDIHFETVQLPNHFGLEEDKRPYYQAEVLVKTWIPIKFITNINNF